MTWTVDSSGSQTATLGVEHSLDTPTTNATYVFSVDTVNMVNGDSIELRCYDMVDGSNYRQMWKGTYSNIQVNLAKVSPPLAVTTQAKFTIRMTSMSLVFGSITGTLVSGTVATGHTSAALGVYYTFGGASQSSGTTGILQHTSGVWTTTGEDLYIPNVSNKVTVATGQFGVRVFPWSVRRI